MKKLSFIAVAIMLGASVAFASSLSIPWFMDNAPEANGVPGKATGSTTLVTLKSNAPDVVVCYVTYYSQEGNKLGPFAPDNSFTIQPYSALAFRPVKYDPDATAGGVNGGQEGAQGLAVPDRPISPDTDTPIPGTTFIDTKQNGSIVIEWYGGGPNDVQGQLSNFLTIVNDPANPARTITMSYAHLLPPGL